MFPELTEEEQHEVVSLIRDFYQGRGISPPQRQRQPRNTLQTKE
jgi:sulfur relay (sulfurtransferase) DsrC/TusE family protein